MAKPPKTKPCVNWSGLCEAVATEAVLSAGDVLFVGITLKKRKGANAGPGLLGRRASRRPEDGAQWQNLHHPGGGCPQGGKRQMHQVEGLEWELEQMGELE